MHSNFEEVLVGDVHTTVVTLVNRILCDAFTVMAGRSLKATCAHAGVALVLSLDNHQLTEPGQHLHVHMLP